MNTTINSTKLTVTATNGEAIDTADNLKYACTNDGLALVDPITGKLVQKIGCNWICDEHCPLC